MSHPDPTADRHPGVTVAHAPVASALLQAVRALGLVGAKLLQEIGLAPPHELVLLELDERGGRCPQAEIVRFMGRDRSTVTNTLQAMERAGLIVREPSPQDGRAMLVALAPRGRAALPAVRDVWARLEQAATAGLASSERERLAASLDIVRESLAAVLHDEADEKYSRRILPPS